MHPEWLRRILVAVRPLLPREFVGSIEINAFKGGIANVNLKQSFKDADTGPPPVVDSRPK